MFTFVHLGRLEFLPRFESRDRLKTLTARVFFLATQLKYATDGVFPDHTPLPH